MLNAIAQTTSGTGAALLLANSPLLRHQLWTFFRPGGRHRGARKS